MKEMLLIFATLAAFGLMLTDPYLMTWGLIIFACAAGTAEWSRRFRG
jgi:hypothetical protein